MNFDDHEENTLSKKEKMLETSIFSNSHQVFFTLKDKFDVWITIEFVVSKLTRLKFCSPIKESN